MRSCLVRCLLLPLLVCLALAVIATPAYAVQGWQAPLSLPSTSAPTGVAIPSPGEADIIDKHGEVVSKAPGISWGAPVKVSGSSRLADSQIAADTAGNLSALWVVESGPHFVVQTATMPAQGSWSAPVTIWEWSGKSFEEPRVGRARLAVDPAGDLAAVWQTYNNAGNLEGAIWAATKQAESSWSAAQQLSPPKERPWEPEVAIDPSGKTTVVWSANAQIFAASGSTGGSWSESEQVSATGPLASEPDVAVDGSGEALVTWCWNCGGAEPEDRVVQFSSKSSGGSWLPPEDISSPGRKPSKPSIAVNPAGDATAVWYYKETSRVQAAYHPAGGGWKEPRPISEKGKSARYPVLAVNRGNAIVAWFSSDEGLEVIRAAVRPDSSGWQSPTTVGKAIPVKGAASSSRLSIPTLTMDRDGNAVVAWLDSLYESSPEPRPVPQAAEYLASPQPPSAPNLIATNPPSPAHDLSPLIRGSAPADSTVSLFTNSTCWGKPVASGSGAQLDEAGLEVAVRNNTTTHFYASATQEGETSSCSGALTYTEHTATIGMAEALANLTPLDKLTAPEDPLTGEGAWGTRLGTAGPGFVDSVGWSSHKGAESAYWTPSIFLDTGTGNATSARVVRSPDVNERYFSLWLDMPHPATSKSGYELRFTRIGNNAYNAALQSWSNGYATTLATVEDVVLPLGSLFSLVDQGVTLSVWVDAGAGYVNLASVSDSEWDNGYAGIATNSTGTRLRRFAAAALPTVSP